MQCLGILELLQLNSTLGRDSENNITMVNRKIVVNLWVKLHLNTSWDLLLPPLKPLKLIRPIPIPYFTLLSARLTRAGTENDAQPHYKLQCGGTPLTLLLYLSNYLRYFSLLHDALN